MTVSVTGTGITFNDSTTQTTAFNSATGVTSLNAQTGAIVTTTFGNIGSMAWVANVSSSNFKSGDTTAGTNLYYPNTITGTAPGYYLSEGTNGSNFPNSQWRNDYAFKQTYTTSGYSVPGGASALSGTWRCMGPTFARYALLPPCCSITTSYSYMGLWVRVS